MILNTAGSRATALLITSLLLASCGGAQFREQAANAPVVPVQAVIDTLKCGLSTAVALDTYDRSGVRGATAVVKLDVNVIAGNTLGDPPLRAFRYQAALEPSVQVSAFLETQP